MDIGKFFYYLRFLNKFQQIQRAIKSGDGSKLENDMEHVAQLGLVAWYLCEVMELKLNRELVLKYALAHDLMEVYSGDTDPYLSDSKYKESKTDREERAVVKMKKEFSELEELHIAINEYEQKANRESVFVYAVDKILPVINVFLSGDDYYIVNKITEEMWREHNLPKIEKDANVDKIIEEIMDYIKDNKPGFFYGS